MSIARNTTNSPPNYYGARKRISRTIPFGYRQHPDNLDYLIPIPDELDALKKAKEFRAQNYPFRSIHDWIMRATGRKISLMGLVKILKERKDV